ncbi:MAG: xanthine/uracil/vitamin C permease, partial [Dehalococcoidia bacterium]|nr:xanthine/uracil/vitamin C permease [Dehalococcoidia bacterium]
MQAGGVNDAIQYEADDSCPPLVALSVGLQGVMLAVAPLVLVVAITSKAGGQDDSYLSWAVFAALIIAGVLTALQATRIGRLGAGHILIMGATPNFVAVSVLALEGGGPSLLASLIVVASLFYIALAIWLPLLRRIITPVVSGTVLMLLAVTILPIALDRVQEVPADAPGATGPTVALITLAVATAMALRASGRWRLWSPLIGIGVGTVVAALFGAYDPQPLLDAAWAGIPDGSGFPGFDFTPGAEFWALLPVFVVITLVGGVKNIGDSVAMQGASRREPRVTDFRLVQGSLNTNGIGIFLSGIAGTPPTTVFSSTSVSLASLTGVASRNVGYVIGGAFVLLALFPKLPALVLTIPNPVMGAFLLTAIALLFVAGIRTVIQDGLTAQKMLVVGIAF